MTNLSSWSAYQGWQIQDGDRLDQDRWRRRRGCSGKSQRGRGIGCRPGHDHDDDDGDDGDDGHYDTDGDVSGVTDTLGKWTPTPLLRSHLGTHDEALVERSFTWPRLHDKHLQDVTIAWHTIAWQACAWNAFEWQKYQNNDGTKPWHTLTRRE